MKQHLINWDKAFVVLDTMSIIKTYIGIIAGTTDDLFWYSNEDTRAKIQWRFQMSPSTVKYALSELKKNNLLTSISRGVFKVNKKYLF